MRDRPARSQLARRFIAFSELLSTESTHSDGFFL
jgi:hypothetical protein